MNTDPAPRPPKGYKLIIDRDSTVMDLIKGDAIFDHGVPDHGWILITENERLHPKSPISVAVLQEVKSTDFPTPPEGYELLPEKHLGSKNYFLPAESIKWDSGKQQWGITTDFCPSMGNLYAVPKYLPPEDPKGEAGKTKAQLQLIPPVFNSQVAKALACGAAKYGPWNWREHKVEMMTYLGAMKRHIDQVIEREDIDSESQAHHLGHVAAGCAIVLDAMQHGTLIDNRPRAIRD